ncbi:MAG: hypothetical protein RLZZ171_1831 [Cyanobacteriota bacterium]
MSSYLFSMINEKEEVLNLINQLFNVQCSLLIDKNTQTAFI